MPDAELALDEPNGLVCAGFDLSAGRLREAYCKGIFPWFSDGQPVLWWSPNPRMVLVPNEFRLHRSLKKKMREKFQSDQWQIRIDTVFSDVMSACAEPRDGHAGTWITDQIIAAYTSLHKQGYAHSIEVWQVDGIGKASLIGGLYGVSLGQMFFGESMFTRTPDASKTALAWLVKFLRNHDCSMIDCQQNTRHLSFMGAREIPRSAFIEHVKRTTGMANIVFPTGSVKFESVLASDESQT